MKFGIGAALRRTEDEALIRGRGRYVGDIRPDGTAWAHVFRSPVAHATFRLDNLDEVRAMPGVLAVYSAAEVSDLRPLPCQGLAAVPAGGGAMPEAPPHPVLADGVVRHVGEPVAFVVAETPHAARDGAESIEMSFEERPALADMAAARAPDAPDIWPAFPGNLAFTWQIGDAAATEEALAAAPRVVEIELVNNRLVTNYLEPRCAVGEYDAGQDRYTLISGSQGAHGLQAIIARQILGIPRQSLRVVTPDTGGGFGTRMMVFPEYPLVLRAARDIGRPVTWIGDRTEHFLADYHGRSHLSRAALAIDADGRFLGLRVETWAEMGAYFSQMGPFIPVAGAPLFPGLYDIPAAHLTLRGVFTNTVPVDAYRGAGRPEAAYLIERLVDKAARELDMAPDEMRRRNFIAPGKRTASGRVYDSGDFDGHMRRAMEAADWAGFEGRRAEATARGRLRGIGLATYVEACAGGVTEQADVTLEADGRLTVRIGSQATGQGHLTAYAQIVAERLGVDPARVTVLQGDTDAIKSGTGTGGSRSIPSGGSSLSEASVALAERIRAEAADLLEASAEDLELTDGEVRIAGTDRATAFADLAAHAARRGETLGGSGAWTPPAPTYPNGTHVVEVEIDPDTGGIEIVQYVVVDDFGVTLNPLLLEGQVHGGVAQGVGQALLERTVHDPDSAQLLTASFQDYALPRAGDLPMIGFETRNVPSTTNLLGMKGAGEAGAIGACPAVVNAAVDALQRAAGVTHIDMPLTPETVWRALKRAQT